MIPFNMKEIIFLNICGYEGIENYVILDIPLGIDIDYETTAFFLKAIYPLHNITKEMFQEIKYKARGSSEEDYRYRLNSEYRYMSNYNSGFFSYIIREFEFLLNIVRLDYYDIDVEHNYL